MLYIDVSHEINNLYVSTVKRGSVSICRYQNYWYSENVFEVLNRLYSCIVVISSLLIHTDNSEVHPSILNNGSMNLSLRRFSITSTMLIFSRLMFLNLGLFYLIYQLH